jgi:hypothetical protein
MQLLQRGPTAKRSIQCVMWEHLAAANSISMLLAGQ